MLHFDFIQELESQGTCFLEDAIIATSNLWWHRSFFRGPVRLASAFDGVSFRRVIDNKQLGKQSLSMYFVLPWLASSDASAFARAVNLAG